MTSLFLKDLCISALSHHTISLKTTPLPPELQHAIIQRIAAGSLEHLDYLHQIEKEEIKALTLSHIPTLCYAKLEKLRTLFPHVKELDLTGSRLASTDQYQKLLHLWPNLEFLNLSAVGFDKYTLTQLVWHAHECNMPVRIYAEGCIVMDPKKWQIQ